MIAVLLPDAESELTESAQWFENQREGLGKQFLSAVSDGLSEIEKHPFRFARPPRSRSPRNIRRLLMQRFPFAIVYEVRESDIRVVAIAHVRRRPNYWRKRLD